MDSCRRAQWLRLLVFSAVAGLIFAAAPVQADRGSDESEDRGRRARVRDFVVTAWWVVFNDPAACMSEAPDGGTCLIIPVGPNPNTDDIVAANGCVTHGSGATVDNRGRVRLVASLYTTDPDSGAPCILGEGGLIDPMGAEVHLVVRSHEDELSSPDLFLDQLTSFNGGCEGGPVEGPNRCADLQAAFHAPCDAEDSTCDPFRSERDVLWLPEVFLEAAGIGERKRNRLALTPAGSSTLLRSEAGLTMVIETSLRDLERRRGRR